MPRPLSASELEWIANYLNQNYAGLSLAEIRERLVGELDGERREVDWPMAAPVALAQATMQPADADDMIVRCQPKCLGGTEGLGGNEHLRGRVSVIQGKTGRSAENGKRGEEGMTQVET